MGLTADDRNQFRDLIRQETSGLARSGEILELRREMEKRFDGVEQRLDGVEQRFGGVEKAIMALAGAMPGTVRGQKSHVQRQVEKALATGP